MVNHASSSHEGGMYIFFPFHKLILCGFNQIFLNHKWIFFNHNQSISTTNNPKQSFAINQFSQQFQPINIIHGLWTRGVYIYIYIAFHFYFNTYIIFTMHIQLIYRTYNLYNAYTRGVQGLYNSYIDYIIYTSSFSISFIN